MKTLFKMNTAEITDDKIWDDNHSEMIEFLYENFGKYIEFDIYDMFVVRVDYVAEYLPYSKNGYDFVETDDGRYGFRNYDDGSIYKIAPVEFVNGEYEMNNPKNIEIPLNTIMEEIRNKYMNDVDIDDIIEDIVFKKTNKKYDGAEDIVLEIRGINYEE